MFITFKKRESLVHRIDYLSLPLRCVFKRNSLHALLHVKDWFDEDFLSIRLTLTHSPSIYFSRVSSSLHFKKELSYKLIFTTYTFYPYLTSINPKKLHISSLF